MSIPQKLEKLKKITDPEVQIAYSLLCSVGMNYTCETAGERRLIDTTGTINVAGFYNYLHAWHEYETMMYSVSQATFFPVPRKLRQGNESKYLYFVPPTKKVVYSQIPFYLSGLTDTPVIVEMIKEIRAVCEKYHEMGVDSFPHGIAFTFWEQYLHLHYNLIKAIGVIALAVFCVISVLLFNPWAASCIMFILVLMTIELAGFLGFVGIKLNPVSAVTLITAVGIGVEFTAHVVFAFLTSLGDRNDRMATAIDRVFVPVIHGALSTLLGIVMLAFSEFEFVVKYFFVVMFALIIITHKRVSPTTSVTISGRTPLRNTASWRKPKTISGATIVTTKNEGQGSRSGPCIVYHSAYPLVTIIFHHAL
ncbi:hypothetical protein L596_003176 [Steinernema carpocapsae]|uniref:SSD domain-containing protein n=1 Tax=Steinernema carpocapsae TaxID=34508 RepID=A0A4V6I7Y5_STECR|nr:hypothetical protein L596_003176 [Steinernema carpocapsae]